MKPFAHFTGKDAIPVAIIGAVIILSLCALSAVPFIQAFVAILVYGLSLYLYLRWGQDTEMHRVQRTQNVTPDHAAYIGEARLADGLSEAVIIVGRGERVTYANPSARALFGISRIDTFIGAPLATIIRDPAVIDMVKTVMADETVNPIDYHIDSPIDRYFRTHVVSLRTGITKPNNGREPVITASPHRALMIFYDITHIVRANALRSDFLANASHELKTPIASLLGYIETLRGHAKDDPDTREKFLSIMQSQTERMQRLIEDLLSLRRIELVEHMAPTDTVDMARVCQMAIETVTPLAERRKIKLDYHSSAAPISETVVTGDQDELIQLVLNLLNNAVHISQPGMTVRLEIDGLDSETASHPFSTDRPATDTLTRRILTPPTRIPKRASDMMENEYIRLRITDTGSGFRRQHLPRIGERFYRVTNDKKSKGTGQGTGLGLAIVKHITLRHRGGLFIETTPDVGTEFSLLIPRAPFSHSGDQ